MSGRAAVTGARGRAVGRWRVMGLIPDFLRAVADGIDQAAGRDPVDRHAEQAREILYDVPEPTADSADTAKVGDPALPDHGRPICAVSQEDGSFCCSRARRHTGQHVASGVHWIAAVWPQEPDTVELTGPVPDEEIGLQLGLARAELRRFQKLYGRASATIGQQRGIIALLRDELFAARATVRSARETLDLAAGESLTEAIEALQCRAITAPLAQKLVEVDVACGERDQWPGYVCTESLGHEGPHVATGATGVAATWCNPDLIAPDEIAAINLARAGREQLGRVLSQAWHSTIGGSTATAAWERVADAAIDALRGDR